MTTARWMAGLHRGAAAALVSSVLFGATTPLAKRLLEETSPLLIAGLLYLGSGLGLSVLRLAQDRGFTSAGLARDDVRWLALATVLGGVLGPALLMLGLSRSDAATASLLLNLESVLTAVLAWCLFREATSRRVVLGFLAIFVGGILLALPSGHRSPQASMGLIYIAGACLCWALDNNVTRKISAGDARAIAAIKGLAAGITNTGLALALGAVLPSPEILADTLLLGFLGYGLSLVLFIVALRHLGTARTGAYFSTAPFIGASLSILLYGQPVTDFFYVAVVLMLVGVLLHIAEHHEHEHVHKPMTHTHTHTHDEHHQHAHASDWDGTEPHTHEHDHGPLRHRHAHFPDIHHGHGH